MIATLHVEFGIGDSHKKIILSIKSDKIWGSTQEDTLDKLQKFDRFNFKVKEKCRPDISLGMRNIFEMRRTIYFAQPATPKRQLYL